MKHYYFSENNQQLGPFTLDELKVKRLKKSTLVWTEGLQDWITADTLDELKNIVISEPPPLPSRKITEPDNTIKIKLVSSTNSTSKYTKETEATVSGIALLIFPIFLKLMGVFTFESEESYNQGRAVIAIASLVIRILVTVWVVGIANRLNRSSSGWGLFAFFFPSISLIVIGLLKKLPLKINLDSSLSTDEQIIILKRKADELIGDLRLDEALSVLIKIKELNNNYPKIEEEIKNCKSKIDSHKRNNNNQQEKDETENILYDYKTSKGKLEIEQDHNYYPDINTGKQALLNGLQAPTGKYKLGFMWYVHIENGIVTKVTLI